jgi:hypothetical protein
MMFAALVSVTIGQCTNIAETFKCITPLNTILSRVRILRPPRSIEAFPSEKKSLTPVAVTTDHNSSDITRIVGIRIGISRVGIGWISGGCGDIAPG